MNIIKLDGKTRYVLLGNKKYVIRIVKASNDNLMKASKK